MNTTGTVVCTLYTVHTGTLVHHTSNTGTLYTLYTSWPLNFVHLMSHCTALPVFLLFTNSISLNTDLICSELNSILPRVTVLGELLVELLAPRLHCSALNIEHRTLNIAHWTLHIERWSITGGYFWRKVVVVITQLEKTSSYKLNPFQTAPVSLFAPHSSSTRVTSVFTLFKVTFIRTHRSKTQDHKILIPCVP